jgi:hypothetical protein
MRPPAQKTHVIYYILKDAFEQIKTQLYKTGQTALLIRFDTADASLADGVIYSLGIEFERGERADFSLLDFSDPYSMYLAPGDTPDGRRQKESASPSFGTTLFQGPLEIYFPKSSELSLKVPKHVEVGRATRVLIDHGASVNGSGYCQLKLLKALEIEALTITETSKAPGEPDIEAEPDLAPLVADVTVPEEEGVDRKISISYKGTPEILFVDEQNYVPDKMLLGAVSSTGQDTSNSNPEFMMESSVPLKVRRGDAKGSLKLSPLGPTASVQHKLELPLSPTLYLAIQQLLEQLKAAGRSLNNIVRVRTASAEAVKVFLIPMEIEADDIGVWHVLAVRNIEGKTKLLNYRKAAHRVESSLSASLAVNGSYSIQRPPSTLVSSANAVSGEELGGERRAADKLNAQWSPRTGKRISDREEIEERKKRRSRVL